MKFVLKPTTFRILLIVSLLVIAAAGAGSFVFGHQEIVKYAERRPLATNYKPFQASNQN